MVPCITVPNRWFGYINRSGMPRRNLLVNPVAKQITAVPRHRLRKKRVTERRYRSRGATGWRECGGRQFVGTEGVPDHKKRHPAPRGAVRFKGGPGGRLSGEDACFTPPVSQFPIPPCQGLHPAAQPLRIYSSWLWQVNYASHPPGAGIPCSGPTGPKPGRPRAI